MKKEIIDLLYQSYDRDLSQKEKDSLDLELLSNSDLADLKDKIDQIRKTTAEMRNLKFSDGFENKVMDQIFKINPLEKTEQVLFDSINQSFRKIAIAAAFLIFSLVVINWISSGEISIPNQANQQTIEDEIELSLADLF